MPEMRDLNVRAVLKFGVVLTILAIVIHLAMALLLVVFRRAEQRSDPPRHPLAPARTVPPEPRLEVAPRAALDALRREEERQLHSYEWIDPDKRRARIPIARALELVTRKGLPARSAPLPAD